MNKKWYKQPEMIVAWSAMFISLLALLATMYEANLERENQLLSIWPRVVIQTHISDKQGYSIEVSNKGLGPAIIKTTNITVDGKTQNSWQDVFEKLKLQGSFYTVTNSLSSTIISQNETVIAVKVEEAKAGHTAGKGSKRIDLEICYCSVYDDCWLVSKSNQYKSVDQCTDKAEDIAVQL
jgi:hypothetical protein